LDLLLNFKEIQTADSYFICGPFDMTMGLKDKLIEFGIPKEKVHFELFTTVEKEPDSNGESDNDVKIATNTKVTIVLDGEETELTITGNESVLDAALDAGLDAPYACTGGSCCTCRAKLMEGTVKMDVNYAL